MSLAEVARRKFTVEEYHRMGEAGIFSSEDRVELIEGEVVEMTPIGGKHLACVVSLNHLMVEAAAGRYFVSVQNPVYLGPRSEPQPDISLLAERPDPSSTTPPGPEKVLVAVEVADTSVSYDRDVELPLYARAGIPEVWIVDLDAPRVEVHSEPGDGGYQKVCYFARGEKVRSESIEGLEFGVSEILG